jgi:8-oxo-dGTP pyrophosphatase MutT (NUDIX family)
MTEACASWHTARVSVKRPSVPWPAASLVLLRDGPDGVETLLIRRHEASRFAAGDFVFPGGRLESEDRAAEAAGRCAGLTPAEAAARLGLGDPGEALAYWVAAIRETFEEVGVLLAEAADGTPLRDDGARFADWRRASERAGDVFWAMLREEGLRLATGRLVYFAHWITPEERPLRFDTRFFAAPMPAGQEAVGDGREIVAVRWLPPAAALAAQARGEISLRLPTMKNLALFDGAATVAEALGRLRDRPVPTIRPRLSAPGPGILGPGPLAG